MMKLKERKSRRDPSNRPFRRSDPNSIWCRGQNPSRRPNKRLSLPLSSVVQSRSTPARGREKLKRSWRRFMSSSELLKMVLFNLSALINARGTNKNKVYRVKVTNCLQLKFRTSEDERRTSQSSDDTSQKKKTDDRVKRQEEPQPMRRERPPQASSQRPTRDSEGSEEPLQSSAPAQTQASAKVMPAPAPKVRLSWLAHNV